MVELLALIRNMRNILATRIAARINAMGSIGSGAVAVLTFIWLESVYRLAS